MAFTYNAKHSTYSTSLTASPQLPALTSAFLNTSTMGC